jgi:hypothetical protein
VSKSVGKMIGRPASPGSRKGFKFTHTDSARGITMNLPNFRTGDALTENDLAQYGCIQSGSVVESRASSFPVGK